LLPDDEPRYVVAQLWGATSGSIVFALSSTWAQRLAQQSFDDMLTTAVGPAISVFLETFQTRLDAPVAIARAREEDLDTALEGWGAPCFVQPLLDGDVVVASLICWAEPLTTAPTTTRVIDLVDTASEPGTVGQTGMHDVPVDVTFELGHRTM